MSFDSDEIRVGGSGRVWVAATNATMPTDAATAMGGGWADLGYTSEEGVTLTNGLTVTDIPVWQSFYPGRQIVSARTFIAAFTLRQWNGATLPFAFGGTVEDASGEFTFTPPSPEDIDLRALCVEVADGEVAYRILIPRGMITADVATTFNRSAAADLPITFSASPSAGQDAWSAFFDDAAMADLGTAS